MTTYVTNPMSETDELVSEHDSGDESGDEPRDELTINVLLSAFASGLQECGAADLSSFLLQPDCWINIEFVAGGGGSGDPADKTIRTISADSE